MKESKYKPLFRIALRLTAICLAAELLLSGVYLLTKDRIAAQQQQKISASVEALFPAATGVTVLDASATEAQAIYRAEDGGAVLGYCVLASGNGYGGAVQLMVAFTATGEICGMDVISHGETKGIGSRALTSEYLMQYQGQRETLSINDVDGISGATRSVKGVLAAVNVAIHAISEVLS